MERQLAKSVRSYGRNVFKQPWDDDLFDKSFDLVKAGFGGNFKLSRLPLSVTSQASAVPSQAFFRGTIGRAFSYVQKELNCRTAHLEHWTREGLH